MTSKQAPILIIDDDRHYPLLMKEACRTAEIPGDLMWLESGKAALSYLEELTKDEKMNGLPRLLLLDVNMPGMNGFEFLQSLREKKNLPQLPVLMLSVSTSPEDIQRSYQLGANAYLVKPTGFGKIQEMLRAIYQFWILHAQS